jgi:transcription antitermination factor NusG
MINEQYWAVVQTFTGQEHKIRKAIEQGDRGTFIPTFVRRSVSRGRIADTERPVLPGYVLFRTTAKGWGDIGALDGVFRVLAHDRLVARRVQDSEMVMLFMGHATGEHNRAEILAPVASSRGKPRRNRKPRASKRLRK